MYRASFNYSNRIVISSNRVHTTLIEQLVFRSGLEQRFGSFETFRGFVTFKGGFIPPKLWILPCVISKKSHVHVNMVDIIMVYL